MNDVEGQVVSEDAARSDRATRAELARGLQDLGLAPGDLVLVRGTPEGTDQIEGGAEGAIDALLEVVGAEGTVAMHTGRRIRGWPRRLFDRQTSPSEMGPISDAFWRRPGAQRSGDPPGAVAAIGPLAEELTRTHDGDERRDSPWSDRTFGQESPWQQLYDRNAKVLLLGGKWSECMLLRMAGVLYTGAMRGRYKPEVPFPSFDHALMGHKLEEEGLVTAGQVGPMAVKMAKAQPVVDRALALLRADELAYFPEGSEDRFGFVAWRRRIPTMQRRLQAGLGKVCITPEKPYGHRGVHQDLWARALVVSDGSTTVGLVVGDLTAIPGDQVAEIRQRVEDRCGLPAANLMVAGTHTHRVPRTYDGGRVSGYEETVVAGLSEAVCQASANMQTARVGVGTIKTEGIAVNRRIKMIDGRVYSSRYSVPSTWYIPPEIIQGCGPVDPWLTTLRLEDLDQRVIGILGNFTGHPLAAFRSKYISGDSFGYAEDLLERVHGGSIALLTNGAEGDTIARGPFPERGPRYDPQAEVVGQMIAGYWLAALARAEALDGGTVASRRREVGLPLRKSWVERVKSGSPDLRRTYAKVLERGMTLTEVQVLRICDTVLVSVPAETCIEAQLTIKEKSAFPNTVVVGLANDIVAYIPSRAAFSEGGYEVDEYSWKRQVVDEEALGLLTMTALEIIDELWENR